MAVCEKCKEDHEVRLVASMTSYATELPNEHPDNPNRSLILCKTCEDDYVQHWTNSWDEYRSSQGV